MKYLTWDQFKDQNPKQTVVIEHRKGISKEKTRVYIGDFSSREDAWEWCKKEGIRNKVMYDDNQDPVQFMVKLLRMSKLINEYSSTQPKNITAILL